MAYIVTVLCFFSPIVIKYPHKLNSYHNVIGLSVIENYNVSLVIIYFYIFIFLILISVFFLRKYLTNLFDQINAKKNNYTYLNFSLAIGICCNSIAILNFVVDRNMSVIPIFCLVLIIFELYYRKNCNRDEFNKTLIASIAISMCLCVFVSKFRFLYTILLLIFCIPVLEFFKERRIFKNCITVSGSMLPLILSLIIEIYHIFVFRSKNIDFDIYYVLLIVSLLVFIFGLLISLLNNKILIILKNKVTILSLVGIVLLANQIPYHGIVGAHIFETANSSVLISDFLYFGKIPLIEHYGGHMLQAVIGGILYGYLNNDYEGAIYSPYYGYLSNLFLSIAFYIFLKQVLKNYYLAFLIVLFIPFTYIDEYYGIIFFSAVSFIVYLKESTKKNCLIFLITTFIVTLLRLDLGFACFGASGLYLIIRYFIDKDKEKIKQIFIIGTILLLILFIFYVFICYLKNINVIDRINEFVLISDSNHNWAYPTLGNNKNKIYSFVYLILPILILFFTVTFYSKKSLVISHPITLLLLLIFLVNLPRALVRHSFCEGITGALIFDSIICIIVSILLILKHKEIVPFGLTFSLLCLCYATNNQTINKNYVDKVFANNVLLNLNVTKEEVIAKERFSQNPNLRNTVADFKNSIDFLLKSNETFLDFSNMSFMYSATRRLDPVYVSQSPLQISNKRTQDYFIKEIENNINNIPIAIFPKSDGPARVSLDGVQNTIRYFKIAEFIYRNYQPLVECSDYVIWCLKEKAIFYKNKLSRALYVQADSNNIIDNIDIKNIYTKNTEVTLIDKMLHVKTYGNDPYIYGLEKSIDLHSYIGKKVDIVINVDDKINNGEYQLFYTRTENESFSEKSSIKAKIQDNGLLVFRNICIDKFTKLRLDFPDLSNPIDAVITQIHFYEHKNNNFFLNLIDYGYDQNNLFHNYKLRYLPWLIEKSYDDQIINGDRLLAIGNGLWKFDSAKMQYDKGAYLCLEIESKQNDETTVELGDYLDKKFIKKAIFNFNLKKGRNKYFVRVSSDYWFYALKTSFFRVKKDTVINKAFIFFD